MGLLWLKKRGAWVVLASKDLGGLVADRPSFRVSFDTLVTPPDVARKVAQALAPGLAELRASMPSWFDARFEGWLLDLAEQAGSAPFEVPAADRWLPARRVAELLGVGEREVTRIALLIGGRKVKGRWQFPESEVTAEVSARSATYNEDGSEVIGRDRTSSAEDPAAA